MARMGEVTVQVNAFYGRCKDCQHWSTEARDDAYPDDYDGVQPLLKWPQRACLKAIDAATKDGWMSEEKLINLPDNLAFVDVYEVFSNELMTGPEFGCVQFQANEHPYDKAMLDAHQDRNNRYAAERMDGFIYGFCPICRKPGVNRERRINGYDTCSDGHRYPSKDAVRGKAEAIKAPVTRPDADELLRFACLHCEAEWSVRRSDGDSAALHGMILFACPECKGVRCISNPADNEVTQ